MPTARASALLALTLVLASCGTDSTGDEPAPASATTPADASGAPDDGAPAASDGSPTEAAPSPSPAEADPSTPASPATGEVALDVSLRHPNGSVLELDAISFEDVVVGVDMELRNGSTRPIAMVLGRRGTRLRLVDDVGNTYNFVVPEGEGEELEIAVGEAVSGTFTFLGPVVEGASSLRLVWNTREPETWSLDTERDSTTRPAFVVDGLPTGP